MDSSIKNLETDLKNAKVAVSEEDKFFEVMGNFAREAREQCDVLVRMGKKMETVYLELSEYFVFDPQKYTLDEFFTDVKTFKDSFNVIELLLPGLELRRVNMILLFREILAMLQR